MTEKLVEIKDLEISSVKEKVKKFHCTTRTPTSSLIREKLSLLLVNQEVEDDNWTCYHRFE